MTSTEQTDTEPARNGHDDRDPGTAVAVRDIEEQLADLADMPGRSEFLALAQMARVMATSGIVPRGLQGKPADVLVLLLTGRDLGIPITAAVRKVYVIDGQPSIAPQLKLGLIRQKGLGSVVPAVSLDDLAVAIALEPHGLLDARCREMAEQARTWPIHWQGPNGESCNCHGQRGYYRFDWSDAVAAGLVRADCTPSAHSVECNANRKKEGVRQAHSTGANFCKDNWRKYARRQTWWRCAGFCADDYFSEATLSLYSPDELGAVTDEDGQLIDVDSVELPAGYGTGPGGIQTSRDRNGADSGGAADQPMIGPWETAELFERIQALPDVQQAAFRERWANMVRLKGWSIYRLPADLLALVQSLLRGVEGQTHAQDHTWTPEGALAAWRASVAPVAAALAGIVAQPTPADTAAPGATGVPQGEAGTQPAPDDAAGGGSSEPFALEAPSETLDPAEQLAGILERVRSQEDPSAAVDAAIAEVHALSNPQVVDLLTVIGLSCRGNEAGRRQRLAAVLADLPESPD